MEFFKKLGGIMVMGILMLSSVFAASLSDYPAPLFIEDTTFDGDIVYGENADPSDIMGLVDAIAAISVIEGDEIVSGSETVSLEGDSWKAETSSKIFELRENISSIQSTLTEDELNALADGTFTAKNDADYEQEIRFSENILLNYEEDTDEDVVDTFLTLDNNQEILTYTLTFTTSAESDIEDEELEDFEDQTLTILGVDYTVTDTSYSNDAIEFTLMGGALLDTLEQGATKEYELDGKTYEVEVTYIGGVGESEVKFKVNGEVTDAMVEGDTYSLADDTDIGVREILEEEAGEITADMVEFYLGADKIVLNDGNVTDTTVRGDVDIGEDTMDEVEVDIVGSEDGTDFLLESISLIYKADDDYWIGPGEKLSEKIEEPESMINWDIVFEGMSSAAVEMIEIVPAGDEEAELKVNVADGQVDIPLAYTNGTMTWPGARDELLVIGTNATALNRIDNVKQDEYVILTTGSGVPDEGEKSYVLQYRGADNSAGSTATLKFKNLASGKIIERSFNKGIGEGKLTLGGQEFTITAPTLVADEDDFNITIDGGADQGYLVTEGDALITIDTTTADQVDVSITESDVNGMTESGVQSTIDVVVNDDNVDEIDINVVNVVSGATTLSMINDPDDNDLQTQITTYGAKIYVKSDDSGADKVEIEWPKEQLSGQAFVVSGEVKSTIIGSTSTKVLKKVTIPLAKSDAEALQKDPEMNKKNYLLVGGPCANKATAKVLGSETSWPGCAAGFEEGIGRLVLVESNDKVAMVVAGYTGLDTTRATRVLKNYQEYTLEGSEVEVLGTTSEPSSVRSVTSNSSD